MTIPGNAIDNSYQALIEPWNREPNVHKVFEDTLRACGMARICLLDLENAIDVYQQEERKGRNLSESY